MADTEKLYSERDVCMQDEHYTRHVMAMTAENLHSKSAIAAELAHRDIVISKLREAVDYALARLDEDDGLAVDLREFLKDTDNG